MNFAYHNGVHLYKFTKSYKSANREVRPVGYKKNERGVGQLAVLNASGLQKFFALTCTKITN